MGFLSSSTSNSSSSTAGSGAISSAEYFAAEHRASMASAQNGRSTPLVLSEPPRPNRDTQYKTKNHAQKSNPLDTLTEAILGTSRAMENWQLKMDKRKFSKSQKSRDDSNSQTRSSGWGSRALKGDFLKSKSDFRAKSEIWN